MFKNPSSQASALKSETPIFLPSKQISEFVKNHLKNLEEQKSKNNKRKLTRKTSSYKQTFIEVPAESKNYFAESNFDFFKEKVTPDSNQAITVCTTHVPVSDCAAEQSDKSCSIKHTI